MLNPYSKKYDSGKRCDMQIIRFTAPVRKDAVSMQRIKDSLWPFRGSQLSPQASDQHILSAATSLTTVRLHSSSTTYSEFLDVLRPSNSNIRCLVVPHLTFISLYDGSKFFPERPIAADCLRMLHALNVNITVGLDTHNQMGGFANKLIGCENLWMLKINAWNSIGDVGFVGSAIGSIREHTADSFRTAKENDSSQYKRCLKEIEPSYTLIQSSELVQDPRELPEGHIPIHDMVDMCTKKALPKARRDYLADMVDDVDQTMVDFPGIIDDEFRSNWDTLFACTGGIEGMTMHEWTSSIRQLLDVPFPMTLREVYVHTRFPLLASYSFLSLLSNLETLVLSYCHITDEILGSMADSISRLGSLRNLDLMHNRLSEFDFRDLCAPDSLMLVNLSHNSILARFATTALDNFVKDNEKMAVVDLGHNPFTFVDEFSFQGALLTWSAPPGARLRLPGTIPVELRAEILECMPAAASLEFSQ